MPAFKCNYFYRQFQQGWTETWFTVMSDLPGAIVRFQTLAPFLIMPRDSETVLIGMRVASDEGFGLRIAQTLVLNLPGGAKPNFPIGAQNFEDLAPTSALCQMNFLGALPKTYMIRGLEDSDVARKGGGLPDPSAQLNKNLNALFTALATLQISGRRQAPAVPFVPVSTVQAGLAAGETDIFGPGSPGFTVNDRVHFIGVPKPVLPWLKGIWRVSKVTPTSITIRYPWNLLQPVTPLSMAAQKVQYTYPVVSTGQLLDFRERKTGRPISPTRGRAPGIHYRRSARVGA